MSQIPTEGIAYRSLRVVDFRAETPPRPVERHRDHLGAYLCGSIAGATDLEVEITPDPVSGSYAITIPHPNYHARMNPSCSWLNPKLEQDARRYALVHEQIHFALLEIEARKVNRAIRSLRVRVAEPAQATVAARESVERLLDAAGQRYVEQSRRFDDEASGPSNRRAQKRWRDEVEARLHEVAADRADDPTDRW